MTTIRNEDLNAEVTSPEASPRLTPNTHDRAVDPSPVVVNTGVGLADPAEEVPGGEAGPHAPPNATDAEFVETIFPSLPEGAHALACAKSGDPNEGGWYGFDAANVEERCRATTNNYFNCASFYPNEAGELRATEAQAAAYHCLLLDDVGTKAPFSALPAIEPTFIIETSAGNYQVGYRLTTPITDPSRVKAAQKRVFGSGLGDKGAGGMARWMRSPNGINGKSQHRIDGEPFQCRLTEWNPDVHYELDDLVARLAPAAAGPAVETNQSSASVRSDVELAHPGITSEVFRPAQIENPVVSASKEAGLYKREAAPGRHEICCPWAYEHTDPIDDTAYLFEPSRLFPFGGFKCHHSHGDKYRLAALLERLGLTRRDFSNKPCIRIVEGELQAMVDAAQVVLAATGEFFQAGEFIVKVAIDRNTGVASLQPQTDADLTLALSKAADWEKRDIKNDRLPWRRCNPLANCIRLLVQAQSYSFLPPIRGIARQPVLDGEGLLVATAGYDAASELYCAFDASKFARPEPGEAAAREALGRLSRLLREFHFASPRDQSTALAAIFTAVLRPGLGRAPAFHVRAPAPGSGKSLLCDVIARFAGPGDPAKVSYPRSDDEATKIVLAALLQAPAALDFDDMTLDWRPFGAINRLLTSPTMTERILGVSKMATVSTDTLVLGSGNNTGPIGDLVRRVAVIDLDARSESPALLRYEGDPLRAIEDGRAAYVADVLTIVEAWIAAGSPKSPLSPIATYGGRWTDFCRQPLVWLGLVDPAEGLIQQLREHPESAALGRLLTAWQKQLGGKAVTLRALIEAADGDLTEAIEDLPFVEGGFIKRDKFGHYLKRNAGRPVAGLKLEKADCRERNAWRVVSIKAPEAAPLLPPSPGLPPPGGPVEGNAGAFD